MNWSNWTSYANSVLQWFLGLFPTLFAAMMENPLIGVPVLLGIVMLVFKLVTIFIGTIGVSKNSKEE